eukprot:jgi/Chrzof1/11372/Cz05g34120.t1
MCRLCMLHLDSSLTASPSCTITPVRPSRQAAHLRLGGPNYCQPFSSGASTSYHQATDGRPHRGHSLQQNAATASLGKRLIYFQLSLRLVFAYTSIYAASAHATGPILDVVTSSSLAEASLADAGGLNLGVLLLPALATAGGYALPQAVVQCF